MSLNEMSLDEDIWLDFEASIKAETKKSMIVHTGIDGIAAACLAIVNNVDADIYAVGSDKTDIQSMIEPYSEITMVDVSISRDELERHFNSQSFSIYDHHARNSFLNQFKNCVMDPRACACKLYFEKEFASSNKAAKEFVDLIDCIDRWQFDSPLFNKAKKLFHLFTATTNTRQYYHRQLIYSENQVLNTRFKAFIESMIQKISSDTKFQYSAPELELIKNEEAKLEADYLESLKTAQFRVDERKRVFMICKAVGNISLVSNMLMKRHTDISYILLYREIDKSLTQISARSRSIEVDMNELDGLEGHPLAAGAYMSNEFIRSFIENKDAYLASTKRTPSRAPPMRIRCKRGAPPSQRRNHKL